MTHRSPIHSCSKCGATSYRRVVARDDQGALRTTDRYQCSGCRVVFSDLKSWRDGEAQGLSEATLPQPRSTFTVMTGTVGLVRTGTMNLKTTGLMAAGHLPTD